MEFVKKLFAGHCKSCSSNSKSKIPFINWFKKSKGCGRCSKSLGCWCSCLLSLWQPGQESFWWTLVVGLVNLVYLFNLWIDLRQYFAIRRAVKPAPELEKVCTQEEFDRSREYAQDKAGLGLFSDFVSHLVTLWILMGGGLAWQWQQAGILSGKLSIPFISAEINQSLWLAFVSLVISTVTSLPLSIYSTFWIEHRHGFNKTTPATFASDTVKTLMLTIVIGGPLIAGLIAIIRWAGSWFYVAAWLLMVGVQLFMIVLYPLVIMPLFNKFEPLPEGQLKEAIEELAAELKFPLTKLYVMDGSRRSAHSNAFFFGLFKDKRIVLFDTLIEQMNTEEIVAVLGHELGHWARWHMLRRLVLVQAYLFSMFWLFGWTMSESALYQAFGILQGTPILIGLMLFQTIFAPFSTLTQLIMSVQSRDHEFEADAFAHDLGHGNALQSALGKLYLKNKALLEPDWIYSCLHHSHPPPVQRLRALKAMDKKEE